MILDQRSAAVSLVAAAVCMFGVWVTDGHIVWAEPRVPVRTAQIRVETPPPPVQGEVPLPVPPRQDGSPCPAPELPGSTPCPPLPIEQPCPPQPVIAAGTPCPVDPPTPAVSLRIRVPACVSVGQEITYRICVENRSPASAHHVVVRNPLPPNAQFVRAEPEPQVREPELAWELGTLEAGCAREICLVLTSTGGDVENCARVQFEHGQCVRTRVGGGVSTEPPLAPGVPPPTAPPGISPPRAELTLRKIGPTRAVLYEPLTYHVIVQNNTDAELTGIVVTDTLPVGLEHPSGQRTLSWDVGTLLPGRGRHIEYQAIARAAGELCNRVVATAGNGSRQEASSCVQVRAARLELRKTAPERHVVNLPVRYEITVVNPGSDPVTNVVLTDPLPAGMIFVSANEGGQLRGDQVEWNLGELRPGERRSVFLVVRTQQVGVIRNEVTATGDRGVTARAEAVTRFEGGSGLTFGVIGSENPVLVGKDMSYVITVLNQGNAAVNQVRVEAVVPDQMDVVRTEPADAKVQGRMIVFELPTLGPNMAADYRVHVRPNKPGDVRFRVNLLADILKAGPVLKEESTTIFADVQSRNSERAPSGDRAAADRQVPSKPVTNSPADAGPLRDE